MTDSLRHCLGRLTDHNRQIVTLRYSEGLKSGEVAERLGRSAHAVYVALSRIHAQLATCIEDRLALEADRDV